MREVVAVILAFIFLAVVGNLIESCAPQIVITNTETTD